MQYSVPQFIDVEDKIIGPLTLKQFLIVMVGGLFTFLFWKLIGTSNQFLFFVLLLPIVGITVGLAWGTFNGRPILANMADIVKFFVSVKERVFMFTESVPVVMKRSAGTEVVTSVRATEGERASRLKRLAYLLDQKTAEEERLIHSGKMGDMWVNKI